MLGPLWITIATGVMAATLGLLYSVLFKVPVEKFLPHVTVGLIMWNFISGSVLMFVFPRPLGWHLLLAIPGLALLVINGVWVSMFFGIIATRYRDVAPLLDSLIQLLFYVTPIVWMTDILTAQGGDVASRARIAQLNPLYHYMEVFRSPLIGAPLPTYHWWVVIGFTIAGLLLALFAMKQWRFRVSYWV